MPDQVRGLLRRSIGRPQRDSLTTQVLRDLAARIERAELKPGDQLPTERELMVTYGVSRTVVREAISSLRASGRIDTQQGRGAFVLEPEGSFRFRIDASDLGTVRDVLQVMEVRIALESEAAALAAQRRTPEQLAEISAALDRLDASIEVPERSVAEDVAFHLSIARATGNAYFTELFSRLAPLLVPRARLDLFKDDRAGWVEYLRRIQPEHAQLHQAIARGDSEAARAAMRLHLTNSRERLRTALDQAPPSGTSGGS
jgi:DNA-binding FadR family transcriptional regulator